MKKTFSTQIDDKVLHLLARFCEAHHLKKTSLLEEIITEGIQRRIQALELAQSLQRGLEDEREGNFYTMNEVGQAVFGKTAQKKG